MFDHKIVVFQKRVSTANLNYVRHCNLFSRQCASQCPAIQCVFDAVCFLSICLYPSAHNMPKTRQPFLLRFQRLHKTEMSNRSFINTWMIKTSKYKTSFNLEASKPSEQKSNIASIELHAISINSTVDSGEPGQISVCIFGRLSANTE